MRAKLYSYLPITVLLNKIFWLSKHERDLLLTSKFLDQPRKLHLRADLYGQHQIDVNQIIFALKLCTKVHISFSKFDFGEYLLLDLVVKTAGNKFLEK